MKLFVTALILAGAAIPAAAMARDVGETGTTGGAVQSEMMDSCMAMAAVRASYTSARNDEIYGIASAKCGHRAGRDAAEVENAAKWATLVGGLRDRRRQQDAMYGIVEVAARR